LAKKEKKKEKEEKAKAKGKEKTDDEGQNFASSTVFQGFEMQVGF